MLTTTAMTLGITATNRIIDIRFPFGRADIFLLRAKKYKNTVDKYPYWVYNIYAAKDTPYGYLI